MLEQLELFSAAFEAHMGTLGVVLLAVVTLILSTTMFATWFYSATCFNFDTGTQGEGRGGGLFSSASVLGGIP